MRRRCVESSSQRLRKRRGLHACLAAAALLLAGCNSTPALPPIQQYPAGSGGGGGQPQTQTEPAQSAARDNAGEAPIAPAQRESSAPPPAAVTAPLDAAAPVPAAAQQQFDQALALAQAGNGPAAERAFDALNAQYPGYTGALVNLAILRAKAGNLGAAEQALQTAIERNPNSATAFNQLGIVYRQLGRFKEADTAYQRAVELDPNYANAYLNLGVLCDLYLQEPQRALQAFERYLELANPPDVKVGRWVTELKARLGNSRSARSEE